MGIGADIVSHSRSLQCRANQRKEILFGNKRSEPIIVMHNREGVISGRSFEEPQLLFDLRAHPKRTAVLRLALFLKSNMVHSNKNLSRKNSAFAVNQTRFCSMDRSQNRSELSSWSNVNDLSRESSAWARRAFLLYEYGKWFARTIVASHSL